jgi:hypothetical protein
VALDETGRGGIAPLTHSSSTIVLRRQLIEAVAATNGYDSDADGHPFWSPACPETCQHPATPTGRNINRVKMLSRAVRGGTSTVKAVIWRDNRQRAIHDRISTRFMPGKPHGTRLRRSPRSADHLNWLRLAITGRHAQLVLECIGVCCCRPFASVISIRTSAVGLTAMGCALARSSATQFPVRRYDTSRVVIDDT